MRNRLLLLLPFLAITAAAGPSTAPADRPAVFRCVLDGNARMIVVALGHDVFAAYDANRCTLAKLWRGTVVLTGPVYDTRHGPQPRSDGKQLLDEPIQLSPKRAPAATQPTDYANVNGYRGYSVKDGVATLHFDFDGVKVDETPTLASADANALVVRRTLKVAGDVTTEKPYAVDVPVSPSLRGARLYTAADGSKFVEVGNGSPLVAGEDKRLRVSAPGTYPVELTFATPAPEGQPSPQ